MNNKLIIEVRGGTIVNVVSNHDLQYVIVDHDWEDNDHSVVSEVLEPDVISKQETLRHLFADDAEIHNDLKRIKF